MATKYKLFVDLEEVGIYEKIIADNHIDLIKYLEKKYNFYDITYDNDSLLLNRNNYRKPIVIETQWIKYI